MSSPAEFDFGAGHPLPRPPCKTAFRSFQHRADYELLDYLESREIKLSFLKEIDTFLADHQELAHFCPQWAEQINQPHVLTAYRVFIKGYTKPARSRSLPSLDDIKLPDGEPPSILSSFDIELHDFFDGFPIRYDILSRIDYEVRLYVEMMRRGIYVKYSQRKLVVLALHAQPVDCYKYYEFNFQTDHLHHRYLGEHFRLLDVPKHMHPWGIDYQHPNPRDDFDRQDEPPSHAGTRARIARACDAGVDVVPVLLEDFKKALCRSNCKRDEIERLGKEAEMAINWQRQTQGGVDIVDMVMDRAGIVEIKIEEPGTPPQVLEKKARRDHKLQVRRARLLE